MSKEIHKENTEIKFDLGGRVFWLGKESEKGWAKLTTSNDKLKVCLMKAMEYAPEAIELMYDGEDADYSYQIEDDEIVHLGDDLQGSVTFWIDPQRIQFDVTLGGYGQVGIRIYGEPDAEDCANCPKKGSCEECVKEEDDGNDHAE